MINSSDTSYFGFLNTIDPAVRDRAVRCLSGKSIDHIGNHIIASDVVEEIVRRKGKFYTAKEARAVAPFTIEHNDTFCASFHYLEGEKRPPNPAYANQDWIALVVTQYCYGIYLTEMISKGILSVNVLNCTAQTYV